MGLVEGEMEMTEEDLKAFLESNKAAIQKQVQERMVERLLAEHRWDISDAISKVVTEFVATEIVPGVKLHLQDQKGAIMAAAITASTEIANKMAEAMVTRAAANIAKDYSFREVMKGIFA